MYFPLIALLILSLTSFFWTSQKETYESVVDTTRFNLVDNKAIFNNCEIDLVHGAKGKEMMKPIKWYLNLDYDDVIWEDNKLCALLASRRRSHTSKLEWWINIILNN